MGWFSKESKIRYFDENEIDSLIDDLKNLKVHEGHKHVLGVRAIAEEMGILLKDSETCIAYSAALYLQWKKPSKSNLRIFNYGRILGDIRYRYEKKSSEELISTGAGVFLVTTERVVFFPPEDGESFSIKLNNLLSYNLLDNGSIQFRKSNSQKPFIIQFSDSKDEDELNFTSKQTARLFEAYLKVAYTMNQADGYESQSVDLKINNSKEEYEEHYEDNDEYYDEDENEI